MKSLPRILISISMILLAASGLAGAAENPAVDRAADMLLQRMGAVLAATNEFTVTNTFTSDASVTTDSRSRIPPPGDRGPTLKCDASRHLAPLAPSRTHCAYPNRSSPHAVQVRSHAGETPAPQWRHIRCDELLTVNCRLSTPPSDHGRYVPPLDSATVSHRWRRSVSFP